MQTGDNVSNVGIRADSFSCLDFELKCDCSSVKSHLIETPLYLSFLCLDTRRHFSSRYFSITALQERQDENVNKL